MPMRPLETQRLIIRPFTMDDFDDIHQILDVDLGFAESDEQRTAWLHWTTMNYEQLEKLRQPPYGDRAVVLKRGNRLIGACGFVPCLGPFGQLPFFKNLVDSSVAQHHSPEVGLFYALSSAYWGHGYATEATKAMIEYAFKGLTLSRIVAATTNDNTSSIRVMDRVGMRIEKNPYPDPAWFQVVGILENKLAGATPCRTMAQ